MAVLFTYPLEDEVKNQLKKVFTTVDFIFNEDMEDAKGRLAEVEVLVGYGDAIKNGLFDQMINLKWIMMFSAGVDKLPLKKIADRKIKVTNARGVYKVPMAEYTISMLLQVYKQEKQLIRYEQEQEWAKPPNIQEISNRTMVVVGAGAIGQEVARLAKAFRMTTYGISRSGRAQEFFDETAPISKLNDYLPNADFVVSVLPGTKETTNIFTAEQFNLMNKDAVFVNIGRGNSVVEEDLLAAIQNKTIAHAVLDVFQKEPMDKTHPFWKEENITITPHLSAKSSRNFERTMDIFKTNLEKYLAGDEESLINLVDVEKGY